MRIFITGTDTDLGKTVISSWLALHMRFPYFKPIQTGLKDGSDSEEVKRLSNTKIYPEIYTYSEPLSPHLAASIEDGEINIEKIYLPNEDNLIIEGAGGVLVPLNKKHLMVDLIQKLKMPVILIARTNLGTINHTLLSLEALRARNIEVIGVIMNGEENSDNKNAIEFYGNVSVLAEFPILNKVDYATLKNILLPHSLNKLLLGR